MDVDGALGVHIPRTGIATGDPMLETLIFVVAVLDVIELALTIRAERDRLFLRALLIHVATVGLAYRTPGSFPDIHDCA